jgi:Rod binding domain-containing protein
MHLAKVAMQAMVSQNSPAAKDPRLERSAHEFEASLMAELLKPLQQTDGLTGEGGDGSGAGSGGALGDFASESLARAISERGGFGIAEQILRQLNVGSPGKPKTDATGPVSSGLKVSGKPPI